MNRWTELGTGLVVISLLVTLGACGGGGGGGGGQSGIVSDALVAAEAVPPPTNPQPGSGQALTDLQNLGLESSHPRTPDQLLAQLKHWTALATAEPNNTAAQAGLSMLILAEAGYEGAKYAGVNLFDESGIHSLSALGYRSDLSPSTLTKQALAVSRLQSTPVLPTGTGGVKAASSGTPSPDTLAKYRKGARDVLLPGISNVIARFDAIAKAAATTKLISITENSKLYTGYRADFQAMSGGLRVLRSAVEMVTAINPDYGSYDWSLDMVQRDANHDGVLTVAEYAPPAPFADLDAAAWSAAGTDLKDAAGLLVQALDNRPSDTNSALNQALAGQNATERTMLRANLADAEKALSGQVTVHVAYNNWDYSTNPPTKTDSGTADIPVNLYELWHNPPASFRALLPPLYVVLDYGEYFFGTTGSWLDVWIQGSDPQTGTATYAVWVPDGWRVEVTVPLAGGNHHLAGSSGSHAFDLTFSPDWTTFTGTIDGRSVTGRPYESGSVYLDWDAKIADLPDKTMSGLFPDPDKILNLVAGNYDYSHFTYGSFEWSSGGYQQPYPDATPSRAAAWRARRK